MPNNPIKIRFDLDNLAWLEEEQKRTGHTITRLVNSAIQQHRVDVSGEELLDCLALPPVVRLNSTSTGFDINRLKNLMSRRQVQRIVFAARPDDLNDFCLVAVIEMDDITVVADTTGINHARGPRILEIRELFKRWDLLNVASKTFYVTDHVEPTRDLPPQDAAKILLNQPLQPFELLPYLKLLASYHDDIQERHYEAEREFWLRLYRSADDPLNEPRDKTPIFQEPFSDEQAAIDRMNAIVHASGGEDSKGQYYLEISYNGRWVVPSPSITSYAIPESSE